MLVHDRPRVRAVAVQHRLEELRLVVDRMAEAGTRSSTTYQMRSECVK